MMLEPFSRRVFLTVTTVLAINLDICVRESVESSQKYNTLVYPGVYSTVPASNSARLYVVVLYCYTQQTSNINLMRSNNT